MRFKKQYGMVSDRLIRPVSTFFDDRLSHVTVILQLARYLPILERVYDPEIYTVFDN